MNLMKYYSGVKWTIDIWHNNKHEFNHYNATWENLHPQSILCINSCIQNYSKCKPINTEEIKKNKKEKKGIAPAWQKFIGH